MCGAEKTIISADKSWTEMMRLILMVALMVTSTFLNAADREPGLTARLSLAHMELHKLAGMADTIKDQDDIMATGDGSRPESEVWDKEDTTRYAIEILKGARYDDNVGGDHHSCL